MAKKGAKKKRRFRAAAKGAIRRARKAFRKRRGTSLGLVGKTGVAIIAGSPLLASGLQGADVAIRAVRNQQVGLMGAATAGFWRFLNGLSKGFGMGDLMTSVVVTKTDGQGIAIPVSATGIPEGAWFKTSVIGGTLVAWDILVSWTSRKFAKVSSGVRFMGTKLTGGR